MNTIKWGIIGCGNVTEVKSGPAFNKVPHSKLVAVMRRNKEKAADYALRHGVEKWYTDAQQLIDDPEVNAIYIATPPLQHEAYAVAALKAGKPVYVEKPMAVTAAAAQRMHQQAAQMGIKLTVAHYRRQQALFKKLKELIHSHTVGAIRLVNLHLLQPHKTALIAAAEENWRVVPQVSGGGLFHDLAPHQLDLMLYFFGKPKSVIGTALNRGDFYNADDTVSGQILFENNILFNGLWCFVVPEGERRDSCEIIGTKGKIRFSVFEKQTIEVTINGEKEVYHFAPLAHVQQPMIEQVVQYFLDKAPNPCSAEEGVEVMRMIEALTVK